MRIKKALSCVAGAAFSLVALAGPSSAATGCQTFNEVIRAALTPSGPVVTFTQASSGGLISGIGTVSLSSGVYSLRTFNPRGLGSVSLGSTTTKFFAPVNNACETVLRSSGTFEIVMGSGTGAFAGAKENGTFTFQETIIRDHPAGGPCAVTGRIFISLQANGTITTP